MKTLTREEINIIDERIYELNEDQFIALLDGFSEKQPFLFAYFISLGEDVFNESESEFLLSAGIVIWEVLRRSNIKTQEVSESDLEQVEKKNMPLLEQFAHLESIPPELAEQLMAQYPQPHLLQFALEAAFEDEDEDIEDQHRWLLFIYLKIALDCLLAA